MTETKEYSDGTTATGMAPLPALSPKQKEVRDAIRHLDDIVSLIGGRNGPSIRLRAFLESLL